MLRIDFLREKFSMEQLSEWLTCECWSNPNRVVCLSCCEIDRAIEEESRKHVEK